MFFLKAQELNNMKTEISHVVHCRPLFKLEKFDYSALVQEENSLSTLRVEVGLFVYEYKYPCAAGLSEGPDHPLTHLAATLLILPTIHAVSYTHLTLPTKA